VPLVADEWVAVQLNHYLLLREPFGRAGQGLIQLLPTNHAIDLRVDVGVDEVLTRRDNLVNGVAVNVRLIHTQPPTTPPKCSSQNASYAVIGTLS